MKPVAMFKNALDEIRGPSACRRVVLALSGGPDSTAMAGIALASGLAPERLIAAHLDHRIRPDSEKDASFVSGLARGLGIDVVIGRSNVPRAARRLRMGLEATARALRYRFLERVARNSGATLVLTAHHLDDQAETLLLRVLRGTGVPGLVGIRARRPIQSGSDVHLVRPLLGCSRAELLDWLRATGTTWRIDPGNEDGSNRRSIVRTRLIPALHGGTPGLSARLAAVAEDALHLRQAWSGCASRTIKSEGTRGVRLSLAAMPPQAILRERLLQLLPSGGPPLDRRAMQRLAESLCRGRGDVDLGLGWTAAVSDGGRSISLLPPSLPGNPFTEKLSLPCPGAVTLEGWGDLRARSVLDQGPSPQSDREVIDALSCPPPYTVRFATSEDRFRPLGFPADTRVFRFLMGRKVPRRDRLKTPVVLDERGVVWVVGHRIAERAKLSGETQEKVALTALPSYRR